MSSIWENAEYKAANKDSVFLNQAIQEGDEPVVMKFTELMKKEQGEKTPDQYRTEDGMEFVFYFLDIKGKERSMSQRSPRGAFFNAMRGALVEPGDWIKVERKGAAMQTVWLIEKQEAPKMPTAAAATPVDQIPF